MHAQLPCLGAKWKLNIFLPALRQYPTHTSTQWRLPCQRSQYHHLVVFATMAEWCVYAGWAADCIFAEPIKVLFCCSSCFSWNFKSLASKEYIKCQTKFHAIIQVYECMWVAKFEPQKHVKMSHVGKTQQIGEEWAWFMRTGCHLATAKRQARPTVKSAKSKDRWNVVAGKRWELKPTDYGHQRTMA